MEEFVKHSFEQKNLSPCYLNEQPLIGLLAQNVNHGLCKEGTIRGCGDERSREEICLALYKSSLWMFTQQLQANVQKTS